jgi:hypothetical protein
LLGRQQQEDSSLATASSLEAKWTNQQFKPCLVLMEEPRFTRELKLLQIGGTYSRFDQAYAAALSYINSHPQQGPA